MRSCEEKEERLMLLESWRDFEKEFGSDSTMERVRKLLPEKVKKRRKLTAEDGVRTGRQPTEGFITEWCEVMLKITNRKSFSVFLWFCFVLLAVFSHQQLRFILSTASRLIDINCKNM